MNELTAAWFVKGRIVSLFFCRLTAKVQLREQSESDFAVRFDAR